MLSRAIVATMEVVVWTGMALLSERPYLFSMVAAVILVFNAESAASEVLLNEGPGYTCS